MKHFLRKSTATETGEEMYAFIKNNELEEKMVSNKNLIVIDVREAAEYANNHIPKTTNIPLGDLESHINDFNKDDDIFLICRTGNRSGMAASKLTELGFNHVYNVVPGMSEWTGNTESIEK